MAHIPVAPHAAGGSAVDPLADLQRLMDLSSVPTEHSHYLMKLLLARLPQNRKEELSVHLFPKALDLMTQNNLWGKLLPFVPCWFKYRSHFVGNRPGAPNQSIPQQQSAIPPPASVKSGPSRELGTIDWAAPPSEPLPQNTLVITPPLTPTNVGEPVLTLPAQALAFEDPLSNPYRMCDPVQSFYLLKLLLARLPIFERAKVANPLLVLATGFMHQNRLWHELSPFNPTWSKLKLPPQEPIQTSDIQLHDPHVEDPLTNVALREFNNEQTFYLLKLLLARLPTHLRPKVSPILLKKGMQVVLENGFEKQLAPYDPHFSKKSRIDSGNSSVGSTTFESTVKTIESKQTLVTNMVKTLPQQTQTDIVLPQDNLQDVSLTTHINTDENGSTSTSSNETVAEAVALSPPKEENVFRPIEPAQPTPSVQPNDDKDGGRRAQSAGYSDERDSQYNRGTSQERGRGRGGYGDRTRPGGYSDRGNVGRGGNGGGRSGRFSPGGHYYDFSGNDKPEFDWTVSSLDAIKSYEDQYCMKMIRGELPEPEDDGEPIIRRINKKNVVFQVIPTHMNLKKGAQVDFPPTPSSAAPVTTTTAPANIPSTTGASTSGSVDAIPSDFNWSASDTATTSATTVPEPIPKEPEQAPQQNGSFVGKISSTPPVASSLWIGRGRPPRNPDGSYPIDITQYTKKEMMMMLKETSRRNCEEYDKAQAAKAAVVAPSTSSASNLPPTSPVKEDLSSIDWSAPSPTASAIPVTPTLSAASSPQSQQSNQTLKNDQPRNRNQSGSSWNERPRQQQPLSPYSMDGPPSAEAINWKPPHAVQQQRAPSNDRSPTANKSGNATVSSHAASTAVDNAPTDWSAPPATPPRAVSAEASGKLRSSFQIAPDCASPVYANELSQQDTSNVKSGSVIYYSAQAKPQVIAKPKSDGNGDNSVPSQESVQQVAQNKEQDWSAPPAKEVPQKVDDWAARPARGNNFAAPPPAVTANTDWSAPPPASENTNWSEAPSVTANTDWSASPTSNDVRPPAANVPVAVDDWSAPPAPTKLVVPEARQPALAKPTESIPQDFDWGTKSEESVVSAVPVAVASQPVPPAQSRPSDYSPLKPNYNSNDNSRNGYVEQYRQPPPQEELPAQKVDFSNFDWSSPATPPATPVVRNSPRLAPSNGGTPNYDQRTPQQGDHDRSRSASNNAGSEDSRRGGRGGFRGRGGYNNGYSNAGESNDNRSQLYSNDNSRGGGTGGWINGYSGDTPRGAHRGGSYRGGRGGYNTYNGNSGAYGHNDPQQSQSNNGDLSSASPPAAAAQASPAPVPYTNKFIGENGVPYSPPLGTVFTEPLPDLTDFDWSSGPGRN